MKPPVSLALGERFCQRFGKLVSSYRRLIASQRSAKPSVPDLLPHVFCRRREPTGIVPRLFLEVLGGMLGIVDGVRVMLRQPFTDFHNVSKVVKERCVNSYSRNTILPNVFLRFRSVRAHINDLRKTAIDEKREIYFSSAEREKMNGGQTMTKSAAILTIKSPSLMTLRGRRSIGKWLQRQALMLVRDGKNYTDRQFTARYLYK